MLILGIETSCDETSAAIIEGDSKSNKVKLLSNVISSSLTLHGKTGGIIPENAAREQIKFIIPVIKQAIENCKLKIENLDAIAVTYGPGLIGSLLIGVETAKTLSYVWKKPLIPTNHLLGHIYANFIDEGQEDIKFPALGLIISGAHTDLVIIKKHGDIKWLGGTRDDAAGECFDKCARLLGYNYPGGPKIAKLAKSGNENEFKFPRPMIGSGDFDFSFSGLKTSFLNETNKHFPVLRINPGSKVGWQQVVLEEQLKESDKQILYDLCASLEKAIADVIVRKSMKAALKYNVKSILIGGGVAANTKLKDTFENELKKSLEIPLFIPSRKLCTDNGAMIGAAAFFNDKTQDFLEVNADPNLYF